MHVLYDWVVIDSVLLAQRLPLFAERAMRQAIVAAVRERVARGRRATSRGLCTLALVRFERLIEAAGATSMRPSLLFAHRDAIVRALRTFTDGRLARRLQAVRRDDIVASSRYAAGFDLVVRGRCSKLYGVALRRLANDGRRLATLDELRQLARRHRPEPLYGVVLYDFVTGEVRTLRSNDGSFADAAA